MLTSAASAGIPFAWAAADEVYGRSSRLREACEKAGKGYVLAVPVNFQVRLPSGRKAAVSAVAAMVPATAWETRSCGPGCKGHRDYAWAWAAASPPRHWVLIRRSLADASDLAFFYCQMDILSDGEQLRSPYRSRMLRTIRGWKGRPSPLVWPRALRMAAISAWVCWSGSWSIASTTWGAVWRSSRAVWGLAG
jgi:hypothetical protein